MITARTERVQRRVARSGDPRAGGAVKDEGEGTAGQREEARQWSRLGTAFYGGKGSGIGAQRAAESQVSAS